MDKIKMVSTSHISQESIEEIKKQMDEYEPDIVAIELDPKRLDALINKQKTSYNPSLIFKIGLLGYLFSLIGSYAQRKLGNLVGTTPGGEMLTAFEEARKREKKPYLIDRDVEITLSRLSKTVPFREKFGLFTEIIKGFFSQQALKIDLTKVPDEDLIRKLKKRLKNKFPQLYNVLVHERNVYMVENIKSLREQNPEDKILVVVGAGHAEEMKEMLDISDKN